MVKLTAELIEQAAQYTNAVRDRELDLRGESGGGRRSGLPARLVAWPGPAACARTAGAWPAACVQRPLPDWIPPSAAEGPPWAFRGALSPSPPCTRGHRDGPVTQRASSGPPGGLSRLGAADKRTGACGPRAELTGRREGVDGVRSEGAVYGPEAVVSPAFPRVGFCCLFPSTGAFLGVDCGR